jgi:hypothetical protein
MMTPPTAPPQACPICGGPLTDAVCPPCIKQAVLDCISTGLAELPPPFGVTARSLATVRGAIVDALMFISVTERTSRLLQFWEQATIRATTRLPSVSAQYISVWDGGTTVRVPCRWSVSLQVAFEIESVDVDGLESLDREYVELGGGIEIDVESDKETPDGIPARAVEPPAVGDVIHYLDIDSQPTTRSALIGSVGARSLHGNIWAVTAETGITLFVIRAFGRDGLAGGKAVWLEYFPG